MAIIHLILCATVARSAPAALRVLLDPGHGGRDQGAIVGNLRESSVTLDVAQRLRRLLANDPNFAAEVTRDQDRHLTLNERTRRAAEWRADVFVSIHVNSSPDARAHGAEFYFRNELAADEESAFLAHREDEFERAAEASNAAPRPAAARDLAPELAAIVGDLIDTDHVRQSARLTTTLEREWTGSRKASADSVRQAPFVVLSENSTPSALVELGFLTNPDDRERLTLPSARERMARDLYRGLQTYRRSLPH